MCGSRVFYFIDFVHPKIDPCRSSSWKQKVDLMNSLLTRGDVTRGVMGRG